MNKNINLQELEILSTQLKGRAKFLRDKHFVKSPELFEMAASKLDECIEIMQPITEDNYETPCGLCHQARLKPTEIVWQYLEYTRLMGYLQWLYDNTKPFFFSFSKKKIAEELNGIIREYRGVGKDASDRNLKIRGLMKK